MSAYDIIKGEEKSNSLHMRSEPDQENRGDDEAGGGGMEGGSVAGKASEFAAVVEEAGFIVFIN